MSIPFFESPKQIASHFDPDTEIVLYHGDVSEFITSIPDNSVSLIITSPPYNLGKDYENRVSIAQYLKTQAQVIAQLYRVLRKDGSLCWQVGNLCALKIRRHFTEASFQKP